jgi:protein TonB
MMKKSFALSIALHVSVIAGVLLWMLHHKEPIKPKVIPVTIMTVAQPKELPKTIEKPLIRPIVKPIETPRPTEQVIPKPLPKPLEQPIVKKQEVVKEQPKVEQKVIQKIVPQTPTVDTKKVQNAYLAYVYESAEKLKIYPRNAKRLSQEGVAYVHFVILSDGTITDISLQKSSGFGLLDEAAVKIITTLAKLKPIPKELGKDKYDITLPINYSLE